MKNIVLGMLLAFVVGFVFRHCENQKDEQKATLQSSQLLQEQLKNVGKLIVTEGHFSDVMSYKDAKKFYMDLYTSEKKALVVVNADVTIAYDLSEIRYDINTETKTLTITNIPEAEIKIYPDLEYYDIQQEYLNPFSEIDYNRIKSKVNSQLQKKIEGSKLKSNAKNRLISELQRMLVLTNSLGWTLIHNDTPVTKEEIFPQLLNL